MVVQTEDVIEVYKEYCNFPTISSARLCNDETPGHVKVQSYWTQRDLERSEKVKFTRTHIVQLDHAFSTHPSEVNNEVWSKESPTGKYKAIVRKLKDKKGEEKQFIDIWSESNKIQTLSVSNLEQHGKIYEADGIFGCFEWNTAETHLLYIAEKKVAKTKSFFDKKPTSDAGDSEQIGDEFVYKDHWGEQLSDKHHAVLCVLDIESGVTSVLENMPDDVSAAQAIWSPDDMGVVCVGLYHEPYRLGIIYCPIRKSALFYIDLKTSQCTMLGHNDKAIKSPVFSPDKTKLIYLEKEIGGPHNQCSVLKMIDWSTKGIVEVTPRVHKAIGHEFPGIYTGVLNSRCWSRDNRRIVLSSFWRSKQELIVIDTETGDVRRITEDATVGSWTLLDVRNDLVVAVCSSPNTPDYMVIAHLPESGKERTADWKPLDARQTIKQISWRILKCDVPISHRNAKFDYLDYECVLLEPVCENQQADKPPLVVFPHGGPHSVYSAAYDQTHESAIFCRSGFSVLRINYRGSTGFGQDSIDSLPGHVGTQDVNDCQDAVDKVLKMGIVDKNRVVITGGSHGGFLTAHLIGQFPDIYKAAVTRNPVINIASMTNTSDIPDWCHVECGLKFDETRTSCADMYATMWNMSPIRYVHDVKTPTLILVGEVDLRVPHKQGQEYYKQLRANGIPARLLSYPGNSHPIGKVDAEADAFMNTIKWFNQYLGVE